MQYTWDVVPSLWDKYDLFVSLVQLTADSNSAQAWLKNTFYCIRSKILGLYLKVCMLTNDIFYYLKTQGMTQETSSMLHVQFVNNTVLSFSWFKWSDFKWWYIPSKAWMVVILLTAPIPWSNMKTSIHSGHGIPMPPWIYWITFTTGASWASLAWSFMFLLILLNQLNILIIWPHHKESYYYNYQIWTWKHYIKEGEFYLINGWMLSLLWTELFVSYQMSWESLLLSLMY